MRLALALVALIAVAVAVPGALDAWDAARLADPRSWHQSGSHRGSPRSWHQSGSHRGSPVAPRPAECGPARSETRTLPGALRASAADAALAPLTALAEKTAVAVTTLSVEPMPAGPGGPERRVRLVATGTSRAIRRLVLALPELDVPLRVEAARMQVIPSDDRPLGRLELTVRLLGS